VDKFEASVWKVPADRLQTWGVLIGKIRSGTVTLQDLTSPEAVAGGVVQRGVSSDDYGPLCPDTGNECRNFYAVSISGVIPSTFLTWFQALAATRNSFKRLPTNAEWQAAALGTPDPGAVTGSEDCNTGSVGRDFGGVVVATGSRAKCKSDAGAYDMVGNVMEWVADWTLTGAGEFPLACEHWPTKYGDDTPCGRPFAMARGGSFFGGAEFAGVFAVAPSHPTSWPNLNPSEVGFRGAR
jgi:formylglycine-generating enzyme required for sulfatase activity